MPRIEQWLEAFAALLAIGGSLALCGLVFTIC
jgi:hypothetical protein